MHLDTATRQTPPGTVGAPGANVPAPSAGKQIGRAPRAPARLPRRRPQRAPPAAMSDDEDFGFEYSDDDQEEDEVDVENQYYNSKGLLETDEDDALKGFEEVVSMEEEKGEWGFKAYKQMVKLQFKRKRFAEMMTAYKQMLTYIKSAVTRNYSEKVINKVLDLVGGSQQMELLQEFYETTLTALQEAKNELLWFKTNLKLGKLWFDLAEYGNLQRIIKELIKSCQNEDGTCNMQCDDNHTAGTAPSWGQPLFVVNDIFARDGDVEWLREMYPLLSGFLNFWLVAPALNLPFAPVVHPGLEGIFNLLLAWAAAFAGFLADGRAGWFPHAAVEPVAARPTLAVGAPAVPFAAPALASCQVLNLFPEFAKFWRARSRQYPYFLDS